MPVKRGECIVNGRNRCPKKHSTGITLKIRYHVTVDDYVEFQRYFCRHSAAVLRQVKRGRWLSGGMTFSIFAILAINSKDNGFYIVAVLSALVAFAISSPIFWYCTDKNIRRIAEEMKDNSAIGTFSLELTADELISTGTVGDSRLKIIAIKQIVSIEKQTFFFLGSANGLILPVDGILEGNRDEFIAALKQKIKPAPAL